ncbi:MAG TPA: DUF3619 family protein [Burkholderiales bacterium]|nr:DUF3619 family protein [Burkholderiales bacterium]
MTERDVADRIVHKLDEGLDSLPYGTLYRLRLARDAALSRAHLGDSQSRPPRVARLFDRRVLVPALALILGLSLVVVWQQQQSSPQADYAELDAQVLSDELPVTAYLDTGFEAWLHHHAAD